MSQQDVEQSDRDKIVFPNDIKEKSTTKNILAGTANHQILVTDMTTVTQKQYLEN